MKYKCKIQPLLKLIATNKGFFSSLCNSCGTLDCENDIEKKKISLLGINVENNLLVKGDEAYVVISCEGYIDKDAKRSNNK